MSSLLSLLPPPVFSEQSTYTSSDHSESSDAASLRVLPEDALQELYNHIKNVDIINSVPVEDQAKIISAVIVYNCDEIWSNADASKTAQMIMQLFDPPTLVLLKAVLANELKPHFASNPHPFISASNGRVMQRPAGGPNAVLDYYEGQKWKRYLGLDLVLAWCVGHIPEEGYEEMWPLIIPPIMTLLDDYDVLYKVRAIKIVKVMLEHVSRSLLKRTGVDGLLLKSMKTALTMLNATHTTELLRVAIPTYLALILHTTMPKTEAQYAQLCELLGDNIIAHIWMYANRDLGTLLVTVQTLPSIIDALGVGCARYLKPLMAELMHFLSLPPSQLQDRTLQIASLDCITCTIMACPSRMHRWKGTILSGVIRCWASVLDANNDRNEGNGMTWTYSSQNAGILTELKDALRRVCACLAKVCPSIQDDEYVKLVELDALFREILPVRQQIPVEP